VALYSRTRKGLNLKWMMTNRGPYRIIRRLNDVNFVVQKYPKSNPEIVHIDRLTHFHGIVPKAWKLVLENENETVSEKSASEDEACASTMGAEATHAKNAAGLHVTALADANNSDECSAANANASEVVFDNTNENVSNIDTADNLIDSTDVIVELADGDASEMFDNGDCFDMSDIVDDSGVGLDGVCIDSPDSCMTDDMSRDRIGPA